MIFIDLELKQCQEYACGYKNMVCSAMIMRKVTVFPFLTIMVLFHLTLSYVMVNSALHWIIQRLVSFAEFMTIAMILNLVKDTIIRYFSVCMTGKLGESTIFNENMYVTGKKGRNHENNIPKQVQA